MTKKYIFNYITTNLLNGKSYIGTHQTDDLNDGYLGSGIAIKKAIKKIGKESFKMSVLELYTSLNEAFIGESKYIDKYNTLKPNGYNLSPKGGLGIHGCFSEETKQKMSNSQKGRKLSKETRRRMSEAVRSRGEDWKQKMREDTLSRGQEWRDKLSEVKMGIEFSEEHKKNISKAKKGKKLTEEHKRNIGKNNRSSDPEVRKKIGESQRGRTLSEETKRKISESMKKRKGKK